MEETFLCFKAEAALFLFPLQSVHHVIPAQQEYCEGFLSEGGHVEAFPFSELWGREDSSRCRFGIVAEEKDERRIFLADEVNGVFTLPGESIREIPEEVRGRKNVFLEGITYIEPLDGWGFVVDPAKVFELKGNRK